MWRVVSKERLTRQLTSVCVVRCNSLTPKISRMISESLLAATVKGSLMAGIDFGSQLLGFGERFDSDVLGKGYGG